MGWAVLAASVMFAAACSDPAALGPASAGDEVALGPVVVAESSARTTTPLPTTPPLPPPPPPPEPIDPVTVLAVGNLGACTERSTAIGQAMVDDAGAIFALGDLSVDGTVDSLRECFTSTFESSLDRVYAVPGDRDLASGDPAAFTDLIADTATGATADGWFVTSMGGWQIIGLNSRCADVGGCSEGSAQFEWLVDVLREQPAECRAVIWHDARFSSAFGLTDAGDMGPLLGRLHGAGTDVLITGSPRSYERLGPSKPNGQLAVGDETGTMHFNVGGGSAVGFDWAPHASSQVREDAAGYARFVFSPEGYTWEFVATSDGEVEPDAGSGTC